MDVTSTRPWHLWIIAPLAVVWMALAACDYLLVTLGAQDYLRLFSADQAAFFTGLEVQAKALWATYVWAGVAGALGLLMREAWAPLALAVAFFAGLGQTSWLLLISNPSLISVAGTVSVQILIVSLAVVLLLWLYARSLRASGGLG